MAIVTYCVVLTNFKFQKFILTKAAGRVSGSVITWSILDAFAIHDSFHQGERPLPMSPGMSVGNKVVRSRYCYWLRFLSPEGLTVRGPANRERGPGELAPARADYEATVPFTGESLVWFIL